MRRKRLRRRQAKLDSVKVGDVLEALIQSRIGAFIDLETESQDYFMYHRFSNQRVKNPAAVLKDEETVKVRVTGIKDGKISPKEALEENVEPKDPSKGF